MHALSTRVRDACGSRTGRGAQFTVSCADELSLAVPSTTKLHTLLAAAAAAMVGKRDAAPRWRRRSLR
jgi:hypothetical protein